MAIPVTKGNTTVRERPDSPEWDYTTQKITCVRTFEGLYADLLTGTPAVGHEMEGYAGIPIESVKIKKAVSGKGTMTVVLETLINPITNPPGPTQPVYEIEWTQIERPIEQHPYFKALFPDPTNVAEFTDAQVTALINFRTWENATDAGTAKSTYQSLTAGSGSFPGFQQLAQKKMRGQTTYLLFAPVARITTLARNVTAANPCGKYFDDLTAFDELPDGYTWLSTADRSTRTGKYGKWQRVQEWTGADSLDYDLYPRGTSANQGDGGGEGAAS